MALCCVGRPGRRSRQPMAEQLACMVSCCVCSTVSRHAHCTHARMHAAACAHIRPKCLLRLRLHACMHGPVLPPGRQVACPWCGLGVHTYMHVRLRAYCRSMLSNPEMLRQMLDPANMRAMSQTISQLVRRAREEGANCTA